MSKSDDLGRIIDGGIVAVMRAQSGEKLVDVAEALLAGGVKVMEVTFTVPNALHVLEEVANRATRTVHHVQLPLDERRVRAADREELLVRAALDDDLDTVAARDALDLLASGILSGAGDDPTAAAGLANAAALLGIRLDATLPESWSRTT